MSDSRVNKQAQVNFHPTASNVVSALNGSHWDGSTLKRPVFFLPLSDETQSGATTTAADYSGNGNDGVIANATASISYAHDDTPWGNRYRKGIHKGSFLLQRLGRSGESGATAGYDFAGTDGIANSKTTYVRLPTNLKHTGSSGTPNTLTTVKRFSQGYTFSCWFKPDSKLFERGEQAGKPHMVALFDLSGSARLMYNVEAGTLNFENDALDGANYDFKASTIKRKLFKPDRWHHVVLSQDRKPSDSDQGGTYRKPRIYLNGKRLELTGTTSTSGAGSMHDSAGILKILLGVHSSPNFINVESTNTRNYKNFPGKVCHFIGWDSQLDDRDIYTIYGASLGAYERKSGNLDIIPLLERQFIKDNKTGSYPTIQRSGIDNRHGSYRSFYDDRNTVVFKKHVDIFPGEINKIKKGQVLEENLMGWWRFQELLNTASNPSQWQGRYKIGSTLYNEVSEDFSTSGQYVAHKNAMPGISTQRVIDSGPNSLSGTLFGDASFTTDGIRSQTRLFTTSSKGPFPKPKDDDIKLMSPDQLVRWGGRKALYLPQTGSKAAFVQFTDQNKPKLRFIRSLKNGTLRDKPWTMSMWFKVEDKGHTVDAAASNDDPVKDYHGIFRIENASSGTVSRARIARDNFTGRWQIKWWVYGMDDDTQLVSTASVQTNYLYENGLNEKPLATGSLPNRGLPEGWHHLAFVYRGGAAKTSEGHWKGRVRSLFKAGSSILLPLNTGKRIQGGRMQIWLDGKQLVTSASLTDIESFKRVSENSANIADGKKIIFGHYRTPGYRVTANTSISGSFSGSIAEVALFNKALKKPGLNRIINNGRFIPEINVADYPMMLDRHHPTMDRMPVTDIKTFGSTRPGISDTRITFTKGDELQPFDDRKTLVATGSNLIGTPASISPDLEAPLASKASFTVNITPKDDVVLMKFMHTGPSYKAGTSFTATHWGGIGRSTLRALARDQGEGEGSSWWNDTSGASTSISVSNSSLQNLPGFVRRGGPIEIGDYTGFVYYNFEDGKWEQMGLYDPASGERIHYDYASTVNLHHGLGTEASSASGSYPQQFKPAPYNRTAGPELDEQSYSSTGRPSLHAMAPYATKYHATSSQVIRVSDYIKQPFLLERVRVKLPVAAFKAFGGDDAIMYTSQAPSAGAGSRFAGVGRVMNRQIHAEDSMVFFVYRQTRPKSPLLRPPSVSHHSDYTGSAVRKNSVIDYTHPTIVSGSNRFLICSGVATFYNDHRHAPGYIDDHGLSHTSSNYPTPYELKHTPTWSYNWAQKLVTSSAEWNSQISAGTQNGVFTGSIIMDITPAVQGRTPLGNFHVFGGGNYARGFNYAGASNTGGGPASKVSLKEITSTQRYKDVGIPTAYWPGGTSWKDIFPKRITGRTSNLGEDGQGTLGGSVYADFIENKVKDSGNQYMLPNAVLDDPRTIVMPGSPVDIGSDASPQHVLSGTGDDPTQKQYPYLLLPEDELIFGLDYLPTIVFGALQANELSGSHIKLLSTGSASVTFYGSFFKEGKPYTPSLNQNLTSNAVHEVIGNDPVVDEYMINSRSDYTGSYIDNLMRGGPPGIKGLVDGYHGGRFSLAYSGNMSARPRFRQSIVGEDYYKRFSAFTSVFRSGSNFANGISLGAEFWTFNNQTEGGPAWGTKHQSGENGRLERFLYKTVQPSGMKAAAGEDSDTDVGLFGISSGSGANISLYSPGLRKPLRAALLRGVRLVTNNERYYDSLMPHLGQYAKNHKGHVIMGRNHKDTAGTRRPAISLPGQTSIMRSGSLADASQSTRGPLKSTSTRYFFAGSTTASPISSSAHSSRDNTHSGYRSTSKGQHFSIEPTARASWARSFKTTKAAHPETTRVTNSVTVIRGGHTNYIEGPDLPHELFPLTASGEYGGQSLGEATGSFINSAAYSGSLSFPFEMSPRRIAGNQRYMLTAYTGTDTNLVTGKQIQPNMYFSKPRIIRQLLFRVGQEPDALTSLFKSYADRARIRVTEGGGRDGQHRTLSALIGLFARTTIRTVHLNASLHTTGTYGSFQRSSRHHGATGFRYGLINTEPMNTSAVFRHDKFGQYRDMLEQRPYSRFFVRTPTTRRRRGMFRIRRRRRSNNIVTRGPVQIRFVSTITDRRIKPVRTYSQNLSHTATSSLPYFDADRDGKFRNRPFPFDESILDSAVIVEEDVD